MDVVIRGLRKLYGALEVLDGIDADFSDHRVTTLIGPSGGGKSTLLRILAGLEAPSSGEVVFGGTALGTDDRQLREHRLRMGIVFQAFNLFPHLTALANVALPLEKVHGWKREEAESTAMKTLERFDLGAHAFKKPGQLSGGQRQRVAIARAIAVRPEMLLFDEPTSALDPEMTGEVLDLIAELKADGREMIVVTHEMGFARHVADHVIFLAEGRALEARKSEEFFESPRTEEARNFLSRTLKY